jgi:hypothetical protein
MVRNFLLSLLFRFFPSAFMFLFSMECRRCGRIVEPGNVVTHEAFFHPEG